jgi:hypothetical protein
MKVVLHELVMALELSSFRVELNQTACVDIIARSVFLYEIRPWVPDRRIKQPGLSVQRLGRVMTTARLDPLRIIRPGVGGVAG